MPWIELAPPQCPNGHPRRRGSYLVGWDNTYKPRSCRTWTCNTCGARMHALEVYGTVSGPLREIGSPTD
ncbi:hypothetical protein [Mycolicibacterium sp.]|uniref:hypothetical protein n=1 Tax=Mycolicibacterium sp. TaxID=2320850 RepID=UPI00355E67AE